MLAVDQVFGMDPGMSIRAILGSLLLVSLATIAGAADKRVTPNTGDTLTIKWGADWVVGTAPPEAPAGTFTVNGPDAASWRMTIAPLPANPTLTGDVGNLRIYVRMLARGLENGGAEVDPEQDQLDGANAHGFYFKVRDTRTKAKARIKQQGGAFTDGFTGALSINSRAYLFEVVWNKGGEAAAAAALAALKTVSIR
jgi:hypothetical protein